MSHPHLLPPFYRNAALARRVFETRQGTSGRGAYSVFVSRGQTSAIATSAANAGKPATAIITS